MTFLDQDSRSRRPGDPIGGGGDLEWEDEAEFVTARPSGLRVLRAIIAAVILLGIGYVIYTGARAWFAAQLDPEGSPRGSVIVNVPSGATVGDLASLLESNEVIPNSTFFRYYADYKEFSDFQAGEYTMQLNMSADEAMARINEGPKQIEYGEFLIPEGLWVSEVLERT
ncbi:MAG: endolytic transglycosylase MltG, partial [Actinomycetota bacterium]